VTPAGILVGASVTANTSASSDPDGTIVTRSINFGDGAISTAVSAAHQYTRAGTYTVVATVTDNAGASASASATVTVSPQFVNITAPTGSTVTGTGTKIAGTGFSGYKITQTAIYVDGVLKLKSTAASISASVTLSVARHVITVQAWDSSGVSFKAQKTVTRTK
jgi:PKD repeat protein